jgi:hypothetical protein
MDMANFITRVELHQASWQDYENLHKQMEARGFSRTIRADDGVWYKLPTAEYVSTTSALVSQVRDLAKQAANATGKSNSVLTCEYTRAAWVDLDRI